MFWKKPTPAQRKKEALRLKFKSAVKELVQSNFRANGNDHAGETGMDSAAMKEAYSLDYNYGINPIVMQHFAGEGFIGYQTCAILSQNWLISKACSIPAKDAIRNGWEVSLNDGEELAPEVKDKIRELDKDFKINENLVELSYFNKVFGIRLALFLVSSTDPEYYEKPFNIDGVTEGAYKGIKQIDPVWCTPLLSATGATDPTSPDFYEPTYWMVQGKKYHHSHFVIVRGAEVPDLLKPTYNYGGIPLTQKIFLRVYSAERSANEAPRLLQTKRLNIKKTDLTTAMQDVEAFKESLSTAVMLRDNYGLHVIDTEEDMTQIDTGLGDVDTVIMTQYQLVAGVANIPVYKLMGTQMKGFSSGEGETENYHEELENEQSYIMTPLLNRHYDLMMKSYIKPQFDIDSNVTVSWNPVHSLNAKEKAEVQEIKSRTDINLVTAGAISGREIQNRIISDPDSGYTGMSFDDDYEIPEDDMSELLND